MNLWVKRTGQLFIAALFLMSCEDDSFLLGFKNKNKKFNVRYQELDLTSSVMLMDSIATDNLVSATGFRLLIGEYFDPQFGTVRSEAYTQIRPSGAAEFPSDAVYDSATLQLRLDFYSYGHEGESIEKFTVHEITEDSLTLLKRYFYHSSLGYDPFPLGEASYEVIYDTLQKNIERGSARADTLLFQTRLDDSFGLKLFANDTVYDKFKSFKWYIKGLAFVPSQSNRIVGIDLNPGNFLSCVLIHYHTSTADSLTRIFGTNPSGGSTLSFSHITTNRTGDLAGLTEPFQGYEPPSGKRYLQNGTPVIMKLDLGKFYDFIKGSADGINDSLTQAVFNTAEISMSVETPPDGMPPPSSLEFRIMNADDHFLVNTNEDDTELMGVYRHVFTGQTFGRFYFPANDDPSLPNKVTLYYNSSKNKYTGFITRYLQDLFRQKEVDRKSGDVPKELRYLSLLPVTPSPGKTVNRAVIAPNSIKLKITYTVPVVSNID